MHRLFVALRPPAAIRDTLCDAMGDTPGVRWQDDDQLHLTLRYIGEVERPVAEDIAAALGGVHAAPVRIALAGVGRFPNAVWAGVTSQDGLAALHTRVEQALRRVGLPPDGRAYLPHITLARFSKRTGATPEIERWIARNAGLASAPFLLDHLTLYESRLGHEGAIYDTVARWPLTAPA